MIDNDKKAHVALALESNSDLTWHTIEAVNHLYVCVKCQVFLVFSISHKVNIWTGKSLNLNLNLNWNHCIETASLK